MPAEPSPGLRSHLKNPFLYSSAALGAALLGILFMMFSRWHEASVYEEHARKERASQQRESDSAAVKQLGGKDFAILSFYSVLLLSPEFPTIYNGRSRGVRRAILNTGLREHFLAANTG